ncbi:MAG: DMT family transporter [Hyphomicrobiales bacterium]
MQPQTIRTDHTGKGIVIILASVLTMAFADAIVKLVSSDLSVWQVFFARSLFAVPLIFGLVQVTGRTLILQNPGWAFIRSLLLVMSWIAFYVSLPVLSLSVAAVAIYTNPIITVLLSATVIGVQVSKRQWFGVVVGFLGVIVILKPGTDAFSWFVLLPLSGAVFYSLANVLTRSKCQGEASLVLTLMLHIAFLVTGLVGVAVLALLQLNPETQAVYPFLLGDWSAMTAATWGLVALLGVLSAGYLLGIARAYQIAPPQIVATFDYGYLVSATLWGFVFFAEIPDVWTISGMVLITMAGLLVAVPASRRQIRNPVP